MIALRMPFNFKLFERIIPMFFVLLGVVLFTPVLGIILPVKPAFYIHAASFFVLGVFFEVPELLLDVVCFFIARQGNISSRLQLLRNVFTIRYVLTHFVGPCSGIMAILSGIYLVHVGGYSFASGWLFWIMVASTFGLYKGFVQHNAYIQCVRHLLKHQGHNPQKIQRAILSPFDHWLIFLELPTYIVIFYAAYAQPVWFNPLADVIQCLDPILPSKALIGIAIVLIGVFLIDPLRWSMTKWSACGKDLKHK